MDPIPASVVAVTHVNRFVCGYCDDTRVKALGSMVEHWRNCALGRNHVAAGDAELEEAMDHTRPVPPPKPPAPPVVPAPLVTVVQAPMIPVVPEPLVPELLVPASSCTDGDGWLGYDKPSKLPSKLQTN